MKKNNIGIILILISSICVCLGQLLWKIGGNTNSFVIILIGFGVYGIGALVMIKSYQYGDVSVLQPLLSSSYVLSSILGVFILSESMSVVKIVGVGFIIIGAIVIGGSKS